MKKPLNLIPDKGEPIASANELYSLAMNKESVYTANWGKRPAAFICFMQFSIVMDLIDRKQLWTIIK